MLPFFVVLNYKVSTLVKGNSNKTTMVCWQGKTTGNEKGGDAMHIQIYQFQVPLFQVWFLGGMDSHKPKVNSFIYLIYI